MADHINGQEEPITLSPEQTEMVREAIKAKEAGEPSYTAQEVTERARAKVRTWRPGQSA